MTDTVPEDVMKLAREAHAAFASSSDTRNLGEIIAAAIMADRERRGEPVAYLQTHKMFGKELSLPERQHRLTDGDKALGWSEIPLYAAPAPAQPVAIKPLEWREDWCGARYDQPEWVAATPWGDVTASLWQANDAIDKEYKRHADVPAELRDRLQATAQADYEARIRSALVETAQPVDVDAVIERCAAICDEASASWKTTAAQAYELDHNEARGWSAKAEARAETADNLAKDIRALKGGA